jgi:sec-independent protein translocase protein TatA
MGSLSPVHWLIVLVVVLALFGPAALSSLGKTLGQGLRSVNTLKKSISLDPLPPAPKKAAPARNPEPVVEAEKKPEAGGSSPS